MPPHHYPSRELELTDKYSTGTERQQMTFKCYIWFDGGVKPTNPGPGYGSFEIRIHRQDRTDLSRCYRWQFSEIMTSNEAEYNSMLHSLKTLLFMNEGIKGNIDLTIFTDSLILSNQMTGNYKCRAKNLAALREKAMEHLKGYYRWDIKWNPRKINVKKFGH